MRYRGTVHMVSTIYRPPLVSCLAVHKPNPTASEPLLTHYSIIDFRCCQFANAPQKMVCTAVLSGPPPAPLLTALSMTPLWQFWVKSCLPHSALCPFIHDHCLCHEWQDLTTQLCVTIRCVEWILIGFFFKLDSEKLLVFQCSDMFPSFNHSSLARNPHKNENGRITLITFFLWSKKTWCPLLKSKYSH